MSVFAALTFNKLLKLFDTIILSFTDYHWLVPQAFVVFWKVSGTQFVNAQPPENKEDLKMSEWEQKTGLVGTGSEAGGNWEGD